MQCYKLRNELSSKDQHKHIYIKDSEGRLIEVKPEMIREYNGVIVIDLQ